MLHSGGRTNTEGNNIENFIIRSRPSVGLNVEFEREIFNIISLSISITGGLVAQAVRRSPPTAGVPSSRLGPSMWVSWRTKRDLGRFFTGFLPFFPYHKFHSTISPPFRFISSALVMVRQAWSAGTLATHGPII